jgi:hypothetical protein
MKARHSQFICIAICFIISGFIVGRPEFGFNSAMATMIVYFLVWSDPYVDRFLERWLG